MSNIIPRVLVRSFEPVIPILLMYIISPGKSFRDSLANLRTPESSGNINRRIWR